MEVCRLITCLHKTLIPDCLPRPCDMLCCAFCIHLWTPRLTGLVGGCNNTGTGIGVGGCKNIGQGAGLVGEITLEEAQLADVETLYGELSWLVQQHLEGLVAASKAYQHWKGALGECRTPSPDFRCWHLRHKPLVVRGPREVSS